MLERPAFVGSVVPPQPLGLNPPKREPKVVGAPKKKPITVTGKHKQWLAKFQEEKIKEARAEEEKAQRQERNRRALAEKSAEMRRTLRELQSQNLSEDELKTKLSTVWEAPISTKEEEHGSSAVGPSTPREQSESREGNVPSSSSEERKEESAKTSVQRRWVRRRKADKPAWARTEEENEQAREDEIDDLIDFANNLNFDKFVSTLEVRESLRYMEDKLERIEAAKAAAARKAAAEARGEIGPDDDEYEWVEVDENGLTEVEALILKRNPQLKKQGSATDMTAQEKGWNSSTRVDDNKAAALAAATAREVAAVKGVSNIHSDASLRTLVTTVKAEIGESARGGTPTAHNQSMAATIPSSAVNSATAAACSATALGAIEPPKVVVIPASATGLAGDTAAPATSSTFRPSNLPYLYRNPSI